MLKNSDYFQKNIFKDDKFSVISDHKRVVYELYGAEIDPQKATLDALIAGGRMPEIEEAKKLGFEGDAIEEGTHPDAIPADFLIDEHSVIRVAHYGTDSGDNIDLTVVEDFLAEKS